MARQATVADRAERLLGSAVIATSPVAGGEISTAVKMRLSSGRTAFLKTLHQAPPKLFEREAAGLAWLSEVDDGVQVPEVLGVDDECLILAWIESARVGAEAATGFGRALAHTHQAGADVFGAAEDGYIGRLPLHNVPLDNWADFYVQRRIEPYLRVARNKHLIAETDADTISRFTNRIPDLVPEEPPARLHGDLWNGNVLWSQDDRVYVIDPAAYGGHREVDLAMLALFGLPQLPLVMEAYEEVSPLAEGWADRLGVHQIFPLLVHACLFGGGYGARAAKLAGRYL